MKELILEVGMLCPNHCLHCSSECGGRGGNAFSFEEFKVLLAAAHEINFDRIVFSGGEPLVFPQLPLFISYAKSNGFSTKIYTSGSGDAEVIESLFSTNGEALPNAIVFSCYGDTPDINTAVTGNEKFFSNLCDMLARANGSSIRTELNFVPMKINYLALKPTFAMFANAIDAFNVLKLVRQGHAIKNWENVHIRDEELQPILKELTLHKKFNVGRSFNFGSRPISKACEAGSQKICISSDGYILPCEVFKYDRFEFKNIHYLNSDELRTVFRKMSSFHVKSEDIHGCLKKEIHRLSLGGV